MRSPFYIAVIDTDTGERVLSTFADAAKADDLRDTFSPTYMVIVERVA